MTASLYYHAVNTTFRTLNLRAFWLKIRMGINQQSRNSYLMFVEAVFQEQNNHPGIRASAKLVWPRRTGL